MLGLPANQKAFGMFPLGYPDEKKEQEDRYRPDRVHIVREEEWD